MTGTGVEEVRLPVRFHQKEIPLAVDGGVHVGLRGSSYGDGDKGKKPSPWKCQCGFENRATRDSNVRCGGESMLSVRKSHQSRALIMFLGSGRGRPGSRGSTADAPAGGIHVPATARSGLFVDGSRRRLQTALISWPIFVRLLDRGPPGFHAATGMAGEALADGLGSCRVAGLSAQIWGPPVC